MINLKLKKLKRLLFWRKKKTTENETFPDKLEKAMGGKDEETPVIKSDYTDDFVFAEVWLAVKDNILYKYVNVDKCESDVQQFKLFEGDELFVDVNATSLVLVHKHGDESEFICRGSNTMNRFFGEFAEKVNKLLKKDDSEDVDAEKSEPHEDHHRHGGHRGPGGRHRGGGANGDCCPKCGRPYKDATRVCPNCFDRAGIIKRLLKYTWKYKGYVIAIVLFTFISSMLHVLSPYLQGTVLFDQVLKDGHIHYGKIFELVAVLIVIQVLSMILTIIYGRANSKFANEVVYDLKTDVFSSMQRLSIKYFTDKETGALMTRVNSDAEEVQWFMLDGIPYLIANIMKLLGIAVVMFIIKPSITLLILIPVPFIVLFFYKFIPKFHKMYSKSFRKRSDMTARMNDSFTAVRVVKAFGKEETENKSFAVTSHSFGDIQAEIQTKSGTVFPLVGLVMWSGSMFIYVLGGMLILTGKMGFGTLTSFVGYVGMIYGPLEWMTHTVQKLTAALNSANRIFEIIDARSVIAEADEPKEIDDFKGEITFENVNFSYVPNRPVLKDISFKVAPGEHIGIVGPSGAGKSTLINLIARLYDTDSGTIKFDGIDIKDLSLKWLHNQVGTVLQDTYLFVGTVYDNIAYTKPDATPDEVIAAAKMADAHDFIMKMEDGYDTWIGTGGKGLSGGERQRLSLARAILKKPKILILDEATSAVDTQTELHIQKALESLSKGRTTFNIAHRLSTLRNADRLIVIENGNLVEIGTHAEIYAMEGVYYKLYQIQKDALKMRGLEEADSKNG